MKTNFIMIYSQKKLFKYWLVLFFVILACQTENTTKKVLTTRDLWKVQLLNRQKIHDTLLVNFQDNSWNAFDGYVKLKGQVFLNNNYDSLKEFKYIQLRFKQKIDSTIVLNFNQNEVEQIHKAYESNPFLKRNHTIVTRSFSVNEYWNLKGAVKQFNDVIEGSKTKSPVELIDRVSESQQNKDTANPYVKKLKFIRGFFYEEGMIDAWHEVHPKISARKLVNKLDNILSFDLKYPIKKLNLYEKVQDILNHIQKADTTYLKNEFYTYVNYFDSPTRSQDIIVYSQSIPFDKIAGKDKYNIIKSDKFSRVFVRIPVMADKSQVFAYIDLDFYIENDEYYLQDISYVENSKLKEYENLKLNE